MGARGQALQKAGRRAWPVVLMAWERWQALTPAEKERYKKRAREATERGRRAIEKQRKRR
jgi:TRAP-type C4-dicarboxylate transport system substrate-binding protein